MMEVKVYLFTEFERNIFNEMMGIIEKARRAQQEALRGNAPPGQRVVDVEPPAAQETTPPENTGEGTDITAQILATITPAGVTRPEPVPTAEPMKYDAVEAAMHAALKAHGTPKTREILGSYVSDGKRVKDLDPAVWPEIVARLEAGK